MANKTDTHFVYEEIKGKILNCEYEPGQFLSEKEIVEEFNTSRTPVREALKTLDGQGLIRIIPNKGTQISTLTRRKLKQIYEIRRILEPVSVRQASKNMKSEDMDYLFVLDEQLSQCLIKGDLTEVFKLGRDIHLYIAQLSGNEMLYSIIKLLREESLRGYIYYIGRYFNESSEEKRKQDIANISNIHNKLISALIEGDEDKAVDAIIEDIDEMMSLIMQA